MSNFLQFDVRHDVLDPVFVWSMYNTFDHLANNKRRQQLSLDKQVKILWIAKNSKEGESKILCLCALETVL